MPLKQTPSLTEFPFLGGNGSDTLLQRHSGLTLSTKSDKDKQVRIKGEANVTSHKLIR